MKEKIKMALYGAGCTQSYANEVTTELLKEIEGKIHIAFDKGSYLSREEIRNTLLKLMGVR